MRVRSVSLVLFALTLAACNQHTITTTAPEKAPEAAQPAAEPVEPLAPGAPSELAGRIVPAEFDWLLVANLQALKGTVLERQFHPWLEFLDSQLQVHQAMELAGAGPLLDHAALLGGLVRPHDTLGNELFAAVFGLRDPKALTEQAKAMLLQEGPPEFGAYRWGTKEDQVAWAAGPDLAPKVEAVLAGEGKSLNDNEEWVLLQKAINTAAPFWALVRVPQEFPLQLSFLYRELPGLPYFPGAQEILGLTHAAISLDFGDRLELRAAVKLQSPEAAQVVVEQARLAAEATLWEPTLLFEIFEFKADGPLVTFAAATSKKAWRVAIFWASVGAQVAAYEEMR